MKAALILITSFCLFGFSLSSMADLRPVRVDDLSHNGQYKWWQGGQTCILKMGSAGASVVGAGGVTLYRGSLEGLQGKLCTGELVTPKEAAKALAMLDKNTKVFGDTVSAEPLTDIPMAPASEPESERSTR